MKNKFAKWKPYIFLAVLLASLVPVSYTHLTLPTN